MNLFWQQNKTIILFFVMLTSATVFSFIDQEVEEKHRSLAEVINEMPKRIPANIETQQLNLANDKKKNQKIDLKIFCDAHDLRMESTQHLVMLEVSTCVDLKDKHQLWIKNETNGFKAQIFKLNAMKFKTDFIQLNKGSNKVSFEGILKDGQKIVQTLEILSGS